MRLTRRHLLLSATAIAGTRTIGSAGAGETADQTGAAPVVLTAQSVRARLPGEAGERDILSLDGSVAGPVLRLVKGAALDVKLVNKLDAPWSLQWHGLRAPNAQEGDWPLAGDRVAPDATQAIRFTPPDSGLTWFHPAALPGQGDLTGRGLRGVLVVEEAAPPPADRDVVLAVAEWTPAADGGPNPLTVNGREAPERLVLAPGARLRLRVVNATTTRVMILGLEGARPLIIAIDGQPSDLFEPVHDSVPVGPGARFEFMIDLPRDPGARFRMTLRDSPEDRLLFEARTEGVPREPLPPVAPLPGNPQLAPAIPLERSVRATLRIEAVEGATVAAPARWRLNGAAALDLAGTPLLSVKQGGSVTLGFDNRSAVVVPLRVHGHVMRLLHAKDDGWEPYWRDSIILLPNSTNHVAFIADHPGRWLIESTLFDQAALGLRSWFVVT